MHRSRSVADEMSGSVENCQAPRFVAYVYPGWHTDRYRPSVDEWTRLDAFNACFEGHEPPPRPLDGRYDDADPFTARRQVAQAADAGIEGFAYFAYWAQEDFVMSAPMLHAFAEARETPGFGIYATWCVRLPHDTFPIPARDALDVATGTRRTASCLDDVSLDALTMGDLISILEDDDPAWLMSVGLGWNATALGREGGDHDPRRADPPGKTAKT